MMLLPRTWLYWVAFIALLWLWLPASAAEIPFNQTFTETVPVTSWTEIRDEGIALPHSRDLSSVDASFFGLAHAERKKGYLQFIDPTRDWNR